MSDEMILVPRYELLAWAEEWLYENDPGDGTDCVTPFDTYLLKSPAEAQPVRAPAEALRCTCPSGDGSLRWPCPAHPPETQPVYAGVDLEGGWIRATAPPSAPVGVAADILRIVDTAIDVCNDRDRPAMAEDLEAVRLYVEQASAPLAQQPAAVDCSLPSEAPVDEVMVRTVAKAINAELEGDENIVLAWKRLGSNERKLRDRMARAAIAALAAQQGGES